MKIVLKGNPISSNNIRRNVGHRRFLTSKAIAQKEDYQYQARQQWKSDMLLTPLKLSIELFFGDKRKRDWDNYHKLSMDALSGIVWGDDVQIQEAYVTKNYDKENPRIEIEIL